MGGPRGPKKNRPAPPRFECPAPVSAGDVNMEACRQAAAGVLAGMRSSLGPEEAYVAAKILVRFFERGGFRLARRRPVDEAAGRVLEDSDGLMPWISEQLRAMVEPKRGDNAMYG